APAPAAEGHLLDLVDQLSDLALLPDRELPVLERHVQTTGGEGAAEHEAPAARGDVDEAADARGQIRPLGQPGDVDVARAVDLQKGQKGAVEPGALEEGELLRRGNDGVG